jgi:hypothetical protein
MLAIEGGPRACFGPAELLATSIIKRVVELGVPVGKLTRLSDAILKGCQAAGWQHLARQYVWLHIESDDANFSSDFRVLVRGPAIVLSLAQLIDELRSRLLEGDEDPQRDLAFPPVSVAGGSNQ